jgi:hypothetical protein
VLIDATQKRWVLSTAVLAVAALLLYRWLDQRTPDGLTGGSTAGLWYGIAGSALMVYAGALAGLRRVPSWWWIGSRKVWMRGHVWLSLLSVILILCHSGFRWGGPLERALWLVFALTIATGIHGLILQQFIPRMMTRNIKYEVPYEQIPHYCRMLCRRGDEVAGKITVLEVSDSTTNYQVSQAGLGARLQFQKFFESHVRRFLRDGAAGSTLLASAAEAELAFGRLRALPGLVAATAELRELQALCEQRRDLPEQERLHHWLHGWLLLHIPLSVVLLILGVAHAVASLYY